MRGKAILLGLLMTIAAAGNAMEPAIVAKAAKSVALGSGAVTVPLRASGAHSLADALPRGRRLFLVVSDLRASEQPGAGYRVYLNLPRNAKVPERARFFAGDINFYNALIGGVGSADTMFSFDVTDIARQLRASGRLSDAVTVTFIPDGRPSAKANAVVRRVEIVEQ